MALCMAWWRRGAALFSSLSVDLTLTSLLAPLLAGRGVTLLPEEQDLASLADLLTGSANLRTGPFPKEAYQLHRAVPAAASRVTGNLQLPTPQGRSYIYLRARQHNGHIAWASPSSSFQCTASTFSTPRPSKAPVPYPTVDR